MFVDLRIVSARLLYGVGLSVFQVSQTTERRHLGDHAD